MTLHVRRAAFADLNTLVNLENRGFSADRFSRRQFRYLLTRANSSVFLLEQSGNVLGAAVMLWRKNSPIGRLYEIVVDPQFQGHGLGARLLRACETEAKKRGCAAVSLEVRADNRQAIALYSKRRYKVIGSLPGYYADGASGLRMVKALGKRPARIT